MNRKLFFILTLLMLILTYCILIYALNLYLNSDVEIIRNINLKYRNVLRKKKVENLENVKPNDRKLETYFIKRKLFNSFSSCKIDDNNLNYKDIWNEFNNWTQKENFIFSNDHLLICKVIKALQKASVLSAKNFLGGSHLKLEFKIEGNQTVYFKPAWYKRDHLVTGEIYSGEDRHNSEILAFYLGAVLNFRVTPIVVGRYINFKSIQKVSDKNFYDTIFYKNEKSQICFYGDCYHCKSSNYVCSDKNFNVEGALILKISGKLNKIESPWIRTYNALQKAEWQKSGSEYCDDIKTRWNSTLLLDVIDASIFDFLIQNGDRHDFELRNHQMLLIDNGKGFGNPHVDFIDILAPLYQCCKIRRSTYERLQLFSGGEMTNTLKTLTSNDLLYPIITNDHFEGMERRLLKIFEKIELCKEKFDENIFD